MSESKAAEQQQSPQERDAQIVAEAMQNHGKHYWCLVRALKRKKKGWWDLANLIGEGSTVAKAIWEKYDVELPPNYPAAGAPAQQGVTLEELKALAEDGLLVTFDKDHRFSFSRVVNLMAEFAEHMLLGRGTREKNTSLRDQLAIIDAIANAIERDK